MGDSPSSPYQCPAENCGKSFPSQNGLSKHQKSHRKEVRCQANQFCKHVTADQRDMNRHYHSSHRMYAEEYNIPDQSAVCNICGKEFTREDNMLKHQKNICRPKGA
ncbi:hypothetical protein ACO1O0_004069 [Amphichorda felina]